MFGNHIGVKDDEGILVSPNEGTVENDLENRHISRVWRLGLESFMVPGPYCRVNYTFSTR